MKRCSWATNDLLINYHDTIWGNPQHDDQELFKMLILESLQAGLSWETVLKKEKDYDKALDHFDFHRIALYDENKINELLNNPKLIRNKRKMNSIVINAKAFITISDTFGSFNDYIWHYVNDKPIIHHYKQDEMPSFDDLSTIIAKDLKKKGFCFVGPTIIYSFMQAIGMYNDHEDDCDFK